MDLKRRINSAYLKGSGKAEPEKTEPDESLPSLKGLRNSQTRQSAPHKPGVPPKSGPGAGKASVPAEPAKGLVKVAGSRKPDKSEIARYLLALGQEEAARILSFLEPSEVEDIAREIAAINHITASEAREVLSRFQGLVKDGVAARGGIDTARSMLVGAFGDSRAERIISQAMPQVREAPFAFLKEEEPQRIFHLMNSEAPGVKAIVIAHLDPTKAAGVLSQMGAQEQKETVIRLSRMQKVEAEVISRIEEGLKEKLKNLGSADSNQVDGTSSLAAIMRHLDPDLEQRLLDALEEEAPVVAETIRDRLFTVDTILMIDDRDLQKVLSSLENREIALFLKGKSDEIRKKILVNVSSNRAQLISEDYVQLGPQRKLDVDNASRDFILRLRRLEQDGTIRVRRKDDEFVE